MIRVVPEVSSHTIPVSLLYKATTPVLFLYSATTGCPARLLSCASLISAAGTVGVTRFPSALSISSL
jgi:hypothetical protein